MANTPRRTIVRTADQARRADEKARASSTALDSFANFAHKLGIGADSPLSSATYGFNPITRNRMLLEWIHRGSWIGGQAVDVVADDMTRAGVEIKSKMVPDQIEEIDEAITSMKIWEAINDTIRWDRLYGGCLAVMLVDGQDPSTPLREGTIRKDQFRGLLVLDRWMVEPKLNDLITAMGPDMGLPKYYRVLPGALGLQGETIHHSRCIRMEGVRMPHWQRLTENLWGTSVLERLYDRMVAFDSATTGAAQLVYKAFIRTYKIEGMRDVIASGGKPLEGLVAYADMMRRFQGIEGMTLMDSKDEFEGTSHQAFSGLSDALVQFGQQLAGALQIPLVRLFGQSPAGFSTGETDLRNYYDMIAQKQKRELLVPMTKVYRMVALSQGHQIPDGFKIKFRSLWQMSDEQKATIANSTVDAIAKAHESGFISDYVAAKELQQSSEVHGLFTNITDQDLEQMDRDIIPPAEEVLPGGEGEEEEDQSTGDPDNPGKGATPRVKLNGQG